MNLHEKLENKKSGRKFVGQIASSEVLNIVLENWTTRLLLYYVSVSGEINHKSFFKMIQKVTIFMHSISLHTNHGVLAKDILHSSLGNIPDIISKIIWRFLSWVFVKLGSFIHIVKHSWSIIDLMSSFWTRYPII